jgi:hypothetical protein
VEVRKWTSRISRKRAGPNPLPSAIIGFVVPQNIFATKCSGAVIDLIFAFSSPTIKGSVCQLLERL